MSPIEKLPPEINALVFDYVNDPFLLRRVNISFRDFINDSFDRAVNTVLKVEALREEIGVIETENPVARYRHVIGKLEELSIRLYIAVNPIRDKISQGLWRWQNKEAMLSAIIPNYILNKKRHIYQTAMAISRYVPFDIPLHLHLNDLDGNQKAEQIWQLTKQHAHKDSLRRIRIRCQGIDFLPNWLSSITSCTQLNLGYNFIFKLPDEIGNMAQLTKINFSYNRLIGFPDSFHKLTNLKVLKLSTNKLMKVPPYLYSFELLVHLNLSNNGLKEISRDLGNLTNLQTLSLNCNQLAALPPEIGKLGFLRRLSVMQNNLEHLPDELGLLSSLRILYLTNNKLTYLPETLSSLRDIEIMDVQKNKIKEIPKGISMLKVWWDR